jgi:hypothetical protein
MSMTRLRVTAHAAQIMLDAADPVCLSSNQLKMLIR